MQGHTKPKSSLYLLFFLNSCYNIWKKKHTYNFIIINVFALQVQLIEFDDDTNLVTKQTFEHPAGEVWRIAAAPQSPDMIATVYNNSKYHTLTLNYTTESVLHWNQSCKEKTNSLTPCNLIVSDFIQGLF